MAGLAGNDRFCPVLSGFGRERALGLMCQQDRSI